MPGCENVIQTCLYGFTGQHTEMWVRVIPQGLQLFQFRSQYTRTLDLHAFILPQRGIQFLYSPPENIFPIAFTAGTVQRFSAVPLQK